MNLMDFYERQQQDIERFKALRDKVWQQTIADNEKLAASFGGKEFLNSDAQALYDNRLNSFNAEWSMEGGSRYNDLLDQHEKQYNQITGQQPKDIGPDEQKAAVKTERSENNLKDKFKNQSDNITGKEPLKPRVTEPTKEEMRQKIAKQQAAIKARNIQKKRGR